LFGWLGPLLFGDRQLIANAAAAAGTAAATGSGVRQFRAEYLHVSANCSSSSSGGSRRARPRHATAARSGSPASPAHPIVDRSTAVVPFDADAAAAEAAAAVARSAAAAAGSSAAAAAAAGAATGSAWVGSTGAGRQSLRRRVKLSNSENSLMQRQASSGRQQQQPHSPGRPSSSSPVGANGQATIASPRRTGRWFDSADGATAPDDDAAHEVYSSSEDGTAATRPPQQQQQGRRGKAAGSVSLNVPVGGLCGGGLQGEDEGLRFSQFTQLRHRAELQE
jgi:hypothetical protein